MRFQSTLICSPIPVLDLCPSSLLPQTVPDKAAQLICTGASHADELGFLFKSNMSHIPFTPPTAEDEALMTNLLQAWTTFAKTGNPNSEET
ncbi:cocaine esterase-like [Homalodisca vitripennis]|uniref:cocaine esterase-like n=1 Tax=Homalodisca vitripennis TaxID=197043 RepID=UPI001EEC6260|nr:cocaine esterase-like [Homalodisca vitripennis]